MDWDRVEAARRRGRALLLLAGILFFVALALGLFSPADPMFGDFRPAGWDLPPKVIGFFGMLFGLVWMWRIYKAPTKDEGAHWRFRDH